MPSPINNPNPEGGVLYAFTQPTPDFKDYHSWYNTEHGPLRVALDFISEGNRYENYYADPKIQLDPPIYLAMYELDCLSGLQERQYTNLTDYRSVREEDVFQNRLTFLERRIYKNLSTKGSYDGPPPILLTVAFVIKDEYADEFNDWYELSQDGAEQDAFWQWNPISLRKEVPKGYSEFIAIHDFDGKNGLDGPEFESAQSKPWRQRILGLITQRDHRRFRHIREFKASDYVKPQ
ncbi:unnamed protein product [Clonostachys rosea]|uniref:EthD domain-containing protein n=1 Tax=Bionectria ochroleuca TaxID=29856 RepID=A0ABY6UQ98_BIOOC|nr:unnamed protein product [Clonostachys rosea]